MEPMGTEEIRDAIRSGQFTVSGLALKLGKSRRDVQQHIGKEDVEEGQEAFREQIIREASEIAFNKKYEAKDRLRALDMLGKEYDVFADKGDRAVKDSLVEILSRAHKKVFTVEAVEVGDGDAGSARLGDGVGAGGDVRGGSNGGAVGDAPAVI